MCIFFVDDSDDEFQVYRVDEPMKNITIQNLLLKFQTKLQTSCWILKIILVIEDHEPNNIQKRFDIQSLDAMLNKDNVELSDKAKEFKQLFENFQKTTPPSLMLGIPPNISNTNMAIAQSLLSSNSNLESKTLDSNNQCDRCCIKMLELEKRLNSKLEDMDRRQNEKLDQILTLLTKV